MHRQMQTVKSEIRWMDIISVCGKKMSESELVQLRS